MTKIEKVLYTAKAHTTGSRDGATSRSSVGRLDVKLSVPGTPGTGTNPEQLFAVGWSACFLSANKIVAARIKVKLPPDLAIDTEMDLGTTDDGYLLRACLNVALPGIECDVAQKLLDGPHPECPYSKATHGNINVVLTLKPDQSHLRRDHASRQHSIGFGKTEFTNNEEDPVNTNESFCNSPYADPMHMAQAELSSFVIAVTEMFGPEQARLAAEDWLDESHSIDSPPRSPCREWRAVTVTASARLANHLTVALHRTPLIASTDAKVLPIPSSDCFASALLLRPRFWCDRFSRCTNAMVSSQLRKGLSCRSCTSTPPSR